MTEKNQWISAHAAAHFEAYDGFVPYSTRCTTSFRIPVAVSGQRVRLVLTERMGSQSMTYGRVMVSAEGQCREVLFGGAGKVTVPADNSETVSDPIDLPVRAGGFVTLWMYTEGPFPSRTATPLECRWVEGEQCGTDFGTDSASGCPLCGYSRLEVETSDGDACAIAAFGDSITAMNLWTAPLGESISRVRPQTALLNLGIGGCRLLRDSFIPEHPGTVFYGRAGLSRFEEDCLAQKGLRGIIIALGINDIGAPGEDPARNRPMSELPSLEDMIAGYTDLVSRCRRSGLKAACATITPLKGVDTYTPERDRLRCAVNHWIRSCGLFDTVLDFDAVVGQGEDMPLRPEYDSGDHIHPSPAGGRAMADSVNVPSLLAALLG